MNRLRFSALLSTAFAFAAFGCGGISDPNHSGSGVRVATVSGALTGTVVPANAHVALVWRKGASMNSNGVVVGSDVPVINGRFTMDLSVPDDAYFAELNARAWTNNTSPDQAAPISGNGSAGSNGDSPGAAPAPSPPPAPGGARLRPMDAVSGGITEPLSAALAGFVVYVDTNGNGALDLEGSYAGSPDQIIGGNNELILTYLRAGGALDYEKLRDRSGILPTTGFNLAWTAGRWLPLDVVELQLSAKVSLPSSVCDSGGVSDSSGSSGGFADPAPVPPSGNATPPSPPTDPDPVPGTGGSSGGVGGFYPSPGDPNLHCSSDGRSFYLESPNGGCPPYVPPPAGLCNSFDYAVPPCASPASMVNSIAPGAPVPAGWPCPVTEDGGVPLPVSDAGT